MGKFKREYHGEIIVNLEEEKKKYMGYFDIPFSFMILMFSIISCYVFFCFIIFAQCFKQYMYVSTHHESSFLLQFMVLVGTFILIVIITILTYWICSKLIRKGLSMTIASKTFSVNILRDLMSQVFVNKRDKNFVLLGEFLDPKRSTEDIVVFSGLPTQFEEFESKNQFKDDIEYQAFKEVSKLDGFTREEAEQYYNQIMSLNEARKTQAKIKRQKEIIELQSIVRDHRGLGRQDALNQRFKQAFVDLEKDEEMS